MRIVDRKTFLALPAGAVFATYAPSFFGEWRIKGESLPVPGVESGGDFIAESLVSTYPTGWNDSGDVFDAYDRMVAGASVEMEATAGRDGAFVSDQLFAVLEASDLDLLRQVLADEAIDPF